MAAGQKIITCAQTLTFFCAVDPEFLVPHVSTLHPYLKTSVRNPYYLLTLHQSAAKEDALTVQHVVTILEQSVPLVDPPNYDFLAQLEKDLEAAIQTHGMMVFIYVEG